VQQLCKRLGFSGSECIARSNAVDPLNFMPTINIICVPGKFSIALHLSFQRNSLAYDAWPCAALFHVFCLIVQLIYCLAEIEKFRFLREDLNNRAGCVLAVLPNVLSKMSCSEMIDFIIPYDFSICE
jgi:hypothetical protein